MRPSRLCGGWPRTTAGASRRLIRTLAGRRRFSLTRPPPSFATAREGQGVFHVLVITEQVPAHPRVQTLRRFLGEPDPEGFGPEPVCPHRVADDFVLQGRERLVRAGIPLPTAPTGQLPVDPTRLVEIGRDYVEPAEVDDSLCQPDVGAAAGPGAR